jgi:hypothetical protein
MARYTASTCPTVAEWNRASCASSTTAFSAWNPGSTAIAHSSAEGQVSVYMALGLTTCWSFSVYVLYIRCVGLAGLSLDAYAPRMKLSLSLLLCTQSPRHPPYHTSSGQHTRHTNRPIMQLNKQWRNQLSRLQLGHPIGHRRCCVVSKALIVRLCT